MRVRSPEPTAWWAAGCAALLAAAGRTTVDRRLGRGRRGAPALATYRTCAVDLDRRGASVARGARTSAPARGDRSTPPSMTEVGRAASENPEARLRRQRRLAAAQRGPGGRGQPGCAPGPRLHRLRLRRRGGPYAEDALPNPRGVYALTKHMGEQAVRALAPALGHRPHRGGLRLARRRAAQLRRWLVERAGGEARPVKLFADQYGLAQPRAQRGRACWPSWPSAGSPASGTPRGAEVVDRVDVRPARCASVFGFDRGAASRRRRMADAEARRAPGPRRSAASVEQGPARAARQAAAAGG